MRLLPVNSLATVTVYFTAFLLFKLTNTPRICHITPVLKALYWLPVKYRIEFKTVLQSNKMCLLALLGLFCGPK